MKIIFKNHYFLFGIIIIILCCLIFYKFWQQLERNIKIKCQANLVMSNYGLTMPVIASLNLENNSGILFYDGPVYYAGNRIGMLSREVHFKAQYNNPLMIMTGTVINKSSKDNIPQDKAELILPDFYVKPGATIFYTISHDNGGYFFTKDNVPMFFCREVTH